MADRIHPPRSASPGGGEFFSNLQGRGPNPTRLLGLLTLVLSGAVLLLLAGLTVAVSVLGTVMLAPLAVVLSPMWVPIAAALFAAAAGFASLCGLALFVLGGGTWLYKYARGSRPPGSDRVDYARSRVADTASHVRDYARGLQGKVKDAAPGA